MKRQCLLEIDQCSAAFPQAFVYSAKVVEGGCFSRSLAGLALERQRRLKVGDGLSGLSTMASEQSQIVKDGGGVGLIAYHVEFLKRQLVIRLCAIRLAANQDNFAKVVQSA